MNRMGVTLWNLLQDRQHKQPDANSPDLVERFVGMLFGKAALESREPFGMKRLSAEVRQTMTRVDMLNSSSATRRAASC